MPTRWARKPKQHVRVANIHRGYQQALGFIKSTHGPRTLTFGLTLCIEGRREHSRHLCSSIEFQYDSNSPSSNPAPPLQNSMFSLEKRGFGDDSGDSQDDSPGAKAAHKTTQHLQAWTCMDRHRKPKQLAQYAKNPGKTRVLPAERTGTELLGVFAVVLKSSRGTPGVDSLFGMDSNRS